MDTDLVVFLVVCALRIFVPLLILRYPLPAIVAALVIDAADQTIFQTMTDIDLDKLDYQAYDKSLDIYYLTIAYIATFRNWRHPIAITVAGFLWYYRLIGVTFFELTEWRPLLIIFPNTFEYFFIFIAIVRLRWDATKLSTKRVIGAAAAIWVFIKLPQEYWIHIAQLDTTDVVKGTLLGVDASDSWGTAFANRPLVTGLIVVLFVAIIYGLVRLWRRLPPADHRLTYDADKVPPFLEHLDPGARSWTDGLAEKLALMVMITIIFAQAVPNTTATTVEVIFGVTVVVVANALIGQWLGDRGRTWSTTMRAFLATLVVNTLILFALTALLPADEGESNLAGSAFFLLMISLIVTLFDRYRPVRPRLTDELGFATVPVGT